MKYYIKKYQTPSGELSKDQQSEEQSFGWRKVQYDSDTHKQKTDSVRNNAVNNIASVNTFAPVDGIGRDCIYRATGVFGPGSQVSENKDFIKNPEKYGFTRVYNSSGKNDFNFKDIQNGDLFVYWRKPSEETKPLAKLNAYFWSLLNSDIIPEEFKGMYPHHTGVVSNPNRKTDSFILHDTDGHGTVRHRDFRSVIHPRLVNKKKEEPDLYDSNTWAYDVYRFIGTPEQKKQWVEKKDGGGELLYLGHSGNIPIGHGGLVYIDDHGKSWIYDSGAYGKTSYSKPGETTLGEFYNLQSDNAAEKYYNYAASGYPMNYRKTDLNYTVTKNENGYDYDGLLNHIKNYYNTKNTLHMVKFPTIDSDKALNTFINEAKNKDRANYNVFTNNCSHAATRALESGIPNFKRSNFNVWPSSYNLLPDVIDQFKEIPGTQIFSKRRGGPIHIKEKK